MEPLRVNEIFYSLQGEGHYTGTAAIFVRLSGCNMRCSFCDTQHEQYTLLSPADILQSISQYPAHHIVITGGEPTMQPLEPLISLLHQHHYFIQLETNGSLPIPEGIDWPTCSPKGPIHPDNLHRIKELKVVFWGQDIQQWETIPAQEYCLQPLDSGDSERNKAITAQTIDYIQHHPQWRLSLQTHKILNVQ